jgi:hypothetical protein
MKRMAVSAYRSWLNLMRHGLLENTFAGFDKHKRAQAVVFFVSIIPTIPLIISDEMGVERGWLWYGWSAIAVPWFITVWGVAVYQVGRTAVRFFRNRRK